MELAIGLAAATILHETSGAMPAGYPELERLSPDEKLKLAAELWQEATSDEEAPPVDLGIAAILEERLRHYEENPESAIPWEEVKKRIRGHG